MADWGLEQTWIDAYGMRGGIKSYTDPVLASGEGFGQTGLHPGMGRVYFAQLEYQPAGDTLPFPSLRKKFQELQGATGISPAAETLIAGCGMGFEVEALQLLGANQVWGCDNSPYIIGRWDAPDANLLPATRAVLLPIDFTDGPSAFLSAGAGNNKGQFRNVVNSRMAEDWPSTDFENFFSSLEALLAAGQSRVYHMVAANTADNQYPGDPVYQPNAWRTLAEWAALTSGRSADHVWFDVRTGDAL